MPWKTPDKQPSLMKGTPNNYDDGMATTTFTDDLRKDENQIPDVEGEFPKDDDDLTDDWDDIVIANDFEDKGWCDRPINAIGLAVAFCQSLVVKAMRFLGKYHVLFIAFVLVYAVYFIVAMVYRFGDDGSLRLLVCTILGIIIYTRYHLLRGAIWLYHKAFGKQGIHPYKLKRIRFIVRWSLNVILVCFCIWVIIDNADSVDNIRPLLGLAFFVLICLLFSNNPRKINWHTVGWGLGMQFLFAVFTLKYKFGQDAINYVSGLIHDFFANTAPATKILFGPETHQHRMLLEMLPTAFFVSSVLALLYFLGAVPLLINTIGAVFSFVFDIQPVESASVAAGIFLDSMGAILCLRPYLDYQSKSQLFVVLTSVFASIGGTYLAIIAQLHIPVHHIIPAMLISAPATFAVCKLIMPETRPKDSQRNKPSRGNTAMQHSNTLDAYQDGATIILPILGNMIAICYSIIGGISWLNNTFIWFGDRVGKHDFSMQYVMSYIFYPIAWLIGVDANECNQVGKLLSTRIIGSSLLAFLEMAPLVGNRHMYNAYMAATNNSGPVVESGDDMFLVYFNKTLTGGMISERSEVITTYCLCGFSGLLNMAFTLACFYVLLPKRKVWMSQIAFYAMIAGNITNCMTACFAGLFYDRS